MTYITAITGPMPNRSMSRENFESAADTLMSQLPDFQTQANALADNVNAMRNDTEAKRAATATLKSETQTITAQAETARDTAQTHKVAAEAARTGAETARDSALVASAAAQAAAGLPILAEKAEFVLRVNADASGVEWSELPPAFDRQEFFTSTTNWVVPAGVRKIRAYAVGAGGDGASSTSSSVAAFSGSGGGFAFGTIAVTPGTTVAISIASGTAELTIAGTALLTANKGGNGTTTAGPAGTASKHATVQDGGAYSGGVGTNKGPGASAGSPLGDGTSSGGITPSGGVGADGGSGIGGASRSITQAFTDPLMRGTDAPSVRTTFRSTQYGAVRGNNGGRGAAGESLVINNNGSIGVNNITPTAGIGGDFAVGGDCTVSTSYIPNTVANGGDGTFLGGGGFAKVYVSQNGTSAQVRGGKGGYGGGGGTASYTGLATVAVNAVGGEGGPACVLIFY